MRLGLLGGTFDPVHNGHLALAEGAKQVLRLDQVLWIPARMAPQKAGLGAAEDAHATPEDRAAMTELAIKDHPDFQLSRIELDRPAPSYTIDTVRQLKGQSGNPGNEWFFLLGADAAQGLSTWCQIDELLRLVQFVVIPRPVSLAPGRGGPRPGEPKIALPAGVREIHVKTPDLSASEIRRRIQEGRSIEGLVPEPVHRYIEEHRLYR